MRTMEFTIEDTEALKPGMEVNVSEGVLPTSYYYHDRACARDECEFQAGGSA